MIHKILNTNRLTILNNLLNLLAIVTLILFPMKTMATTCEASYCAKGCTGHLFFDADLLYLRASEGGLSEWDDSTFRTDFIDDDIFVSELVGRSHEPNFQWHFGVRLGLGFGFDNSRSGFEGYWTHFNSTSNSHGESRNKWKINLNVADFIYAYEYPCARCFALIPFIGLKYAHITQQLNSRFINFLNEQPLITTGSIKEKFSGVGPLFGMRADQGLRCGFTLYGELSGALILGSFNTKSFVTQIFSEEININDLKKHDQDYQIVIDSGLGVSWKGCFQEDLFLTLRLGLESHRYFNHNRICGYGDLVLDGVVLVFGLEY